VRGGADRPGARKELMHYRWVRGEFEITTDASRIDLNAVHQFLARSYWAAGIPLAIVERSIKNSLCFGIYKDTRQVGFARVITDRATFAYLGDVFVLPEHRGQGLAKWMMECIVAHPDLQGLRRWSLLTRDAHGLYRQFGFTELKSPERWMERHHPEIYASARENKGQQK
jgi:GNAT superfamily N-acetyltransferase